MAKMQLQKKFGNGFVCSISIEPKAEDTKVHWSPYGMLLFLNKNNMVENQNKQR